MSSPIVVTGIGIISSIGNNLKETTHALLHMQSGIKPVSILNTRHAADFVLGEVKKTQEELNQLANADQTKPWTRTALLGLIAAREAIQDARLDHSGAFKTGIVSASTVGGMDRSELYYKDFIGEARHKEFIDTHHAGDHTEKIAETLDIKDYLTTISTACSSSLNSIMFGTRLIKNGILDRVLVGGSDALSKFTLNGFNTLMILDKEHCRPFDESRAGLNLGEGAAYLVLEKEEAALKQGKKIYAYISGYANANDAHHQTASSEEGNGPFLAMQHAITKAGLIPDDIDYINVHGTGTENNDLTEGMAMKRLFGTRIPPFSSTKAFTGHTLGAAGVIESVFSIIALQEQKLLPNINFKTAIPEINLIPVTEVKNAKLGHVLTNSFGFGGNDSTVVFSSNKTRVS
ncbi:MAG: beta-ketoacyl-[acyl-carrier-protein] synthase family protein [Bacteroidetes bacterium]|nr:beta-ketoacyl-[acyl-carrier-protein] synthase family protein [Bacteroidota bacterium]